MQRFANHCRSDWKFSHLSLSNRAKGCQSFIARKFNRAGRLGSAAGDIRPRAAEFIDAHAGQPVTVTDIAAAAGLTPRALRHAFRSRYNITPAQYQRQVRLELLTAQPGDGVTVAGIARKWGWASPARFTAAYRQQFSTAPSRILRT